MQLVIWTGTPDRQQSVKMGNASEQHWAEPLVVKSGTASQDVSGRAALHANFKS